MAHPTEGVLRRLLDAPAGVGAADRGHVVDCPQCLALLTEVRADADVVDAALATNDVDVDVDEAWLRLSAAQPAPSRVAQPRRSRLQTVLRRPATAALAVIVVLAGAGTAAANGWLQIFRTESVAPIGITTADLVSLPDLSGFGELEVTGDPEVREVADAQAAAEQTGLDVPQVAELPRGISGEPTYQVGGEASATFTFSVARAAEAAAREGGRLPTPPPGLDGSSVRLAAGPGVAQLWSSGTGAPGLIVGRAVAPTAFSSSSGVPFDVVRDYLLSLPGLPDDVAEQLRTFTADGSTLPLPVPEDEVTTTPADVDGVPATVLATRDRALSAVVWVDDGIVTVVAGSLGEDEVLQIAEDLQ